MIKEASHVRFDNDSVLRSIACELAAITTAIDQRLQQELATKDCDAASSSSSSSTAQGESNNKRSFDFCLESFLTRPRTCTKLFPSHVQKRRYSKITVQERLILVSIGPSPTVRQEQSKADQEKKVKEEKEKEDEDKNEDNDGEEKEDEENKESKGNEPSTKGAVLVAGLEVLEYTLFPLHHNTNSDHENGNIDIAGMSQSSGIERIIYIAKVDTSGCWPLPEIDTHNLKSPARALVSGYLKAMRMGSNGLKAPCISSMYNNISTGVATSTSETAAHVSSLKISSASNEETASASPTWTNTTGKASGNEEQGQQPSVKKTSLYVFARAQPQYLFKDSAKNPGKHVLNDRGLVRWWKNMITSACGSSSNSNTDGGSSASLSSPPAQTKEANQENDSKAKLRGWWLIPGIGAERQALSAIQSPIPSSASILSLSLSTLTWTYGHPDKGSKEMAQSLIPQFPDDPKSRMMRSPMGAGGMVDIDTFWELAAIGEESGAGKITGFFRVDEEHEQSQAQMKTFSKERGQGEKRTKTTVPNPLVGSTDDYTKVINRLLELDFSDPIVAIESTREWISRVDKWIKFSNSQEVKRQQKQQEQLAMDETQQQCESRVIAPAASPNMPSWIQRRVVSVWLQSVEENKETGVVVAENAPTTTGQQSSVVNSLSAGFIKRKPFDSAKSPQQPPVVNVLSAGLTKRKAPDSTPATATPAPPSPPTSAPVEASVAPETSASSAPAVNVLGASFIKKRKVDS